MLDLKCKVKYNVLSGHNFFYRGKDDLSLSKYSPKAFWIFPSKSANLSRDLCTPWILKTSMTKGDLDTFFMRARNSVLMLQSQEERILEYRSTTSPSSTFWHKAGNLFVPDNHELNCTQTWNSLRHPKKLQQFSHTFIKKKKKIRVRALPLESLCFNWQQVLYIGTPSEDPFQVYPASLDIYPDIKQCHDTIQFVFPAKSIFFKYLQIKCKQIQPNKN